MSIQNERLRQSWIEAALRKQGKSIRNPFWNFGQLSSSDFQSVISKLPHADPPVIQIMDAGANQGKLVYLPDLDTPDDPDLVYL